MLDVFFQLSLLILAALVISAVARILKQPLIIAYIFSGILISIFFATDMRNETIISFSQFGVAFLLFIVGLHLNPKVIKEVGFISLVLGLIQIAVTSGLGFFLASWLGFSTMASLYIAFALTFSSTIIVTKILSDKSELDTLYGKIAVGILIVQDLVVIFILMILSYFSIGSTSTISLNYIFYDIIAVISLIFASIYILPNITKFVAKNQELLFLFSVGWCFLLAALFYKLGFSMEIGALIAGISLSVSPYHTEISSKIRPLRDFFIIIFFIMLGLQIDLSSFSRIIKPAIILSGFVILVKFFVLMISMGASGYKKRTSFMTSISLVQISEFSFIMVLLGVSLGHIGSDIASIVILTGIITIVLSTYFTMFSNSIFRFASRFLNIFEKRKTREEKPKAKNHDFILFGYNRIGFSILQSFIATGKKYIIVDFNPETIKKLQNKKINCIYGDAEDSELLEELGIKNAKLVVSTIPDYEANHLILTKIKNENKDCIVILNSHQIEHTFKLYDLGADYVIMPHFLGGQYTSKLIEKFSTHKNFYVKEKEKQIENLKERLEEGHEHPRIEKHG